MSLGFGTDRRCSLRGLIPVLTIALVSICGYLWRCLHLFKNDHYYIISPDSYFFHWQAQRLLSHQDIPMKLHSGLTYPLAYMAKAVGSVFGIPQTEALRWAGLLLPPFLGVLSIVLLYVFVSRIYSVRVATFSAIVWAVAFIPVSMLTAGYLDRDGLSVLLVMIGTLTFYLSRGWRFHIGRLELGWLGGVVAVVPVEALLYIEWLFIGPLMLLVVIAGFWAMEIAVALGRSLIRMMMGSEIDILETGMGWLRLIPSTLWRSDWRPLSLLVCLNLVLVSIWPGVGAVYDLFATISRSSLMGTASVQELQGMSFADLLGYQLFIIPALAGVYVALKNGCRADSLFLGWFACLFALGLFARRFFLFAAPSICVLSGVGLGYLLDLGAIPLSRANLAQALSYDTRLLGRYTAAGLGIAVLLLALILSVLSASRIGSNGLLAADNDWETGMAWLRDNTPQEAVVVSHWTYGYYILDLADRRPVVDNGYYGWDEERNHDVSVIYCATDASEAVSMMQKYGAHYMVISTLEYQFLPTMTEEAMGKSYGDGKSIPTEMRGSVYARALSGKLVSEGGLQRVYPEDPNTTHLPLVILAA
jgi:asparagine N-glycosylation enzyme membrane subunit Stt3